MLNFSVFLRNMRTNQSYPVKNVPAEISKLQIKGEFSIKFPLGFNRGISAEKVKFVKEERELLLNDYQNFGASANWILVIYYKNLDLRTLTLTLDFTDFTFDAVTLEIGFKITPLLDRVRNFEKTNEYISFIPQNFNLKSIIPQNFQASFRVNDFWSNPNTLAGIKGEGMMDADGLEYNAELMGPNKDKAIVVFRVTKKSVEQDPSYFNLDLKFEDLKIRRWTVGINLVLKLKADYMFFYTDGTWEYVNIVRDSCTSSTYYTTANLQIVGVFPKNVDFATLPSDPNKTLGDVFIAVYLEVDTDIVVLLHPILITCDKIFINHNFIQIDKVVKGVKLSDYFREINILAGAGTGQPIFGQSSLFIFDDIIITTTNMMLNNSKRLPAKIMDVMEAISILEGFVFVEIDGKYFFTTLQALNWFTEEIELTNFTDVNYEPVEQIVDFEIGEDAEVGFKILPRLFEKRKYFLAVETFANLDTYTIKPKIISSGELILNKVLKEKYDDDLLFLRVEQLNFGSFGSILNQRYSNQNVINRLALLLNSLFTMSDPVICYRNESNQVITHNLTTNKMFDKFYRNIKIPADSAVIIDLLNLYKRIRIGNKIYLPVEYSLNLEPNTLNIKLLGFA
jgi:hypothetical protein